MAAISPRCYWRCYCRRPRWLSCRAASPDPHPLEKHVYTATGRGGVVNARTYPSPSIAWAVDCADPKATCAAAKAGLIYRMFESREKADAFADKKNAKGYDAIAVPVSG